MIVSSPLSLFSSFLFIYLILYPCTRSSHSLYNDYFFIFYPDLSTGEELHDLVALTQHDLAKLKPVEKLGRDYLWVIQTEMSSWNEGQVEYQKIRLKRGRFQSTLQIDFFMFLKLHALPSFTLYSKMPIFWGFLYSGTCHLSRILSIKTLWLCNTNHFCYSLGTNTAKIVGLLEGTFVVDLPTRDHKDHDKEVESTTNEEEKHLPKAGTTSHVAAQSVTFTLPSDTPCTTLKWPAPQDQGLKQMT